MGRDVTVQDIFSKALEQLEGRAAAYYPVVRRLHHASRVTVFNVFIFSKLSNLMNFYSIPYGVTSSSVNVVVERIASRMIINFNHAFLYSHLIRPVTRFGPSPPVRDAWAVSVATLAAQADLSLMGPSPARSCRGPRTVSRCLAMWKTVWLTSFIAT